MLIVLSYSSPPPASRPDKMYVLFFPLWCIGTVFVFVPMFVVTATTLIRRRKVGRNQMRSTRTCHLRLEPRPPYNSFKVRHHVPFSYWSMFVHLRWLLYFPEQEQAMLNRSPLSINSTQPSHQPLQRKPSDKDKITGFCDNLEMTLNFHRSVAFRIWFCFRNRNERARRRLGSHRIRRRRSQKFRGLRRGSRRWWCGGRWRHERLVNLHRFLARGVSDTKRSLVHSKINLFYTDCNTYWCHVLTLFFRL